MTSLGDDGGEIVVIHSLNFRRAQVSKSETFAKLGGSAAVDGVAVGTLAFVNAFADGGLTESYSCEEKNGGEKSHAATEMQS